MRKCVHSTDKKIIKFIDKFNQITWNSFIMSFDKLTFEIREEGCDGLDGKAEDPELENPGFNPRLRQEKAKNMFSCF